MAKISAYGEHKLCEISFRIDPEAADSVFGDNATYSWVLTSGGRVLERCRLDHEPGAYSPSTGLRLVARIKSADARNIDTLRRAIVRRGYREVK
jgi:hypothetical protein